MQIEINAPIVHGRYDVILGVYFRRIIVYFLTEGYSKYTIWGKRDKISIGFYNVP